MSRFPFDGHRLEAVFDVLGFDRERSCCTWIEAASAFARDIRLPQWTITGVSICTGSRASYAGRRGIASAFIMSVEVQRESFYI